MIPRIIHYCRFGRGEMPQLAQECIASWHKYMPDWEYELWTEAHYGLQKCLLRIKAVFSSFK